MARSTIGWVATGLGVLWTCSWAMAGADAEYKTLFAQEEEKVVAGKDAKATVQFAARLLAAAQDVGEQKDLQILLCQKAYDFGMKDASGYQTAIDAMKFQMEVAPATKPVAQARLLEACQLRFARSTGADRRHLGEELVNLLIAAGDDQAAARQAAQAVATYRKALGVATGVKSGRIGEITDKLKRAVSRVEAQEKLAALKDKLKSDPRNAAARTGLILAHLGEFDNPAEAVKLLDDRLDEKWRTYVPLASRPVKELAETACLELACWYAEIAEQASLAGKTAIMSKAAACCQRYLELHPTRDSGRLKASLLLERLTKAVEKATPQLPRYITLELGKGAAMKMILIPAGKFMMGSPEGEADRESNEGPQHEVTIGKPFYMGLSEVTQSQYQAVGGNNPSFFRGDVNPVERVTWDDAVEFCRQASQKCGQTVRLPTEAEWEYACRAGSKTRFHYGDDYAGLGQYGWYRNNSSRRSSARGLKKPNAFGLYDMHGNVWEWCSDWYADTYDREAARDPQGPASGRLRVARGGSWDRLASSTRCASRLSIAAGIQYTDLGFRVVVEVK